ncbi:MAG: ATP-binding protein [Legionellaceae bacterium]|nr:ATP-binding protein [Legionellaceae bacterium]
MLWKSVKQPNRQVMSLVQKLMCLYALSTMGLLIVVALFFYPTFNHFFSQLDMVSRTNLTVECFKQLIILVLFASISTMLLGQLIARRGLHKIQELEEKMAHISIEALDARLNLADWPVELTRLGERFNHMLDRLEQAFIQLSQFSADIAHELRHPIHHLKQMTELELSKPSLPASSQDLLVSYMTEFDQLSALVNQLLFIAKFEQGQIPLHQETLSAQALVFKIFEYYQAWADEKKITLSCEGESLITVDPVLMQRVLSNLIANALQHTGVDGVILVKIESDIGFSTRLVVKDNGAGIEAAHLSRLCQRFYRTDSARSSREETEGLGLGLAIVKSIMDLHAAKLDIHSHLGQGTEVVLTFK